MRHATGLLAGAALLASLAACQNRAGTETGQRRGGSADTVVTRRQVEDTAVITRDTEVNVDTTRREGDPAEVRPDTVKRSRGAGAETTGTDTAGP